METINKTWKPVTIGGFTGILMGAGAMHFAQSIASTTSVNEEEQAAGTKSLDDLSFREAFATARADMGPRVVFYVVSRKETVCCKNFSRGEP